MINSFKVEPGTIVDLKQINAVDDRFFNNSKSLGIAKLLSTSQELKELQSVFYADHTRKMIIVLQGMDTSGKDGTIRCVFQAVNPQGVHVHHFDVPTRIELSHDYLWRIHKKVPSKGEICIFNRSHYEDCITVRVHNLVPESVWEKRFRHINEFEKMLVDEGTIILKFFLHISEEEQLTRIQNRIKDPEKHWKFHPKDLEARSFWGDYYNAYNDAISQTSTEWAPWFIIPADKKWYRNIVVSQIIVDTLKKLNLKYPTPEYDFSKFVVK